jgi:hypothetical protein
MRLQYRGMKPRTSFTKGRGFRRHRCEICETVFICDACTAIMHDAQRRIATHTGSYGAESALWCVEHEPGRRTKNPERVKKIVYACPKCIPKGVRHDVRVTG